MAGLFSSGRIVDLILVMVAAETLLVILFRRRIGGAGAWLGLVGHLGAGACLLTALRVALTGAWWGWIGLWLALALACHAFSLSAAVRNPARGMAQGRGAARDIRSRRRGPRAPT